MNNIEQAYQLQLSEKQKKMQVYLAPLYSQAIEVFPSAPEHYRMRAEFRVWHEGTDSYHIMFNKDDKKQYRVDALPAACRVINNAMKRVIELVKGEELLRKKLFQIDYLASTSNELVISFIYHKPLDEAWQQKAEGLRSQLSDLGQINIIGRAKKQKVVIGNDFVTEELKIDGRHYTFQQIENSFTQPNAEINVKMIEWVLDKVEAFNDDLLELYCGAGNFSIPLACAFNQVFATEISKTSVKAAQVNIAQNDISNLRIARLSSEEFTEAYLGKREFFRLQDLDLNAYTFSTVLVDPPRAGLDDETLALISRFENIVYISCNPITLVDNLQQLHSTHEVSDVALFDQFPFTEHIESGVILKRR